MTVQSRIRQCLTDYGIESGYLLTVDELAAEIELAVFPPNDDHVWHMPIWFGLLTELGICANCLCMDCGCCIGCGQVDADLFGVHGYPGCV